MGEEINSDKKGTLCFMYMSQITAYKEIYNIFRRSLNLHERLRLSQKLDDLYRLLSRIEMQNIEKLKIKSYGNKKEENKIE